LSSSDFLGGRFLLGDTHPVRIHIIHRFNFTETNTLRISITEIVLKILSINEDLENLGDPQAVVPNPLRMGTKFTWSLCLLEDNPFLLLYQPVKKSFKQDNMV
jgi:hypothetical protein